MTNITVFEYLELYDEAWTDLMHLQNHFPLPEYAARSMLTAWKMSYDQAKAVNWRAAKLLDLWAFLYTGDVWYDLVASPSPIATDDFSAGLLHAVFVDMLSFRHSLGILSNYSLVDEAPNNGGYQIHPVLHTWCLHNFTDAEEIRQLCGLALRMVALAVPSSTSSNSRDIGRRLVPHAKVVGNRSLGRVNDEHFASELHTVADFLSNWESFAEVESLYLRAMKGWEKLLGPNHPSTLNTTNSLGLLRKNQGQIEESERLYERALKGRIAALGQRSVHRR